jgi:hypothetical protein
LTGAETAVYTRENIKSGSMYMAVARENAQTIPVNCLHSRENQAKKTMTGVGIPDAA